MSRLVFVQCRRDRDAYEVRIVERISKKKGKQVTVTQEQIIVVERYCLDLKETAVQQTCDLAELMNCDWVLGDEEMVNSDER